MAACALAAGIVVAGLATLQSGSHTSADVPLTYEVERGEQAAVRPTVDDSNRADPGEGEAAAGAQNSVPGGARMKFSDGTRILLRPAASARVVSVEDRGARIAIADGDVTADVVHRQLGRWRFDAGPFSVFVHGTSFRLGWAASKQELRLQMYTGVVTVKGPLGTESIEVRGGQTLTVRVPEKQMSLLAAADQGAGSATASLSEAEVPTQAGSTSAELADGLEREPAVSPPPSGAPLTNAAVERPLGVPAVRERVAHRASPATAGGPGAHRRARTWRDLVAAGRSAEVVGAAQGRGLGDTLAQGSRDDLAALADAARYSRRNDIARRTLYALRDRFPISESARDAAFFLGRLEEADHPKSPRSLEWYRRYRAEAPKGLYLADSIEREMLIMQRLYGDDAARPIAREYLTRFPRGNLAPRAGRILD